MTRIPYLSMAGLVLPLLSAFLLTLPVPGMGAVSPVPWEHVAPPSPEALRSRAGEYWSLLVSGNRAAASLFLRIEDRSRFLENREQAFRNPRVETIELSEDATRATLEIAFDLLSPVGVFPWKIRQEWAVIDGEWMAEHRESPGNPFKTPPPQGPALDPE